MALALLSYDGSDAGKTRFRFDIGKNRYYRYAVGGKTVRGRNGLETLDRPRLESRLQGPLPPSARGRGRLEIPGTAFDREHRKVQLLSFRTQDLSGPAVSEVVSVPAGWSRAELPALSFSQEQPMQIDSAQIETVPFSYRQARYSNAMFLGALAGLLPSILPKVAPFVGNLLGGLAGGGKKSGGGAAGAIAGAIGSPEIVKLLQQLLGQVKSATGAAAGKTPVAPAVKAAALGRRRAGRRPPGQAVLSEAQVAPALLAALPALMPLLQKVLSPQTIQAVISQPNKLAQTAIGGIKDLANLGIKADKQYLEHLRAIHPGLEDPALDQLLAGMSLGLSQPDREPSYKRVDSVRLSFGDVQTHTLYGQTKLPFAHRSELAFPVSVETPRAISRALLQLTVKRPETLEVVLTRRHKLESVSQGPLSVVPGLAAHESGKLEAGRDYLICVSLIWKNRAGSRRGTSMQQRITLVGEHTFDRVEESSQLIPLSDVARHREFWHKVWQGSFTDDVKRFELTCRYYYVLDPKRSANARLQTKLRLERGERRREGQLKAGMDLSPTALNRLIPQLEPGRQSLSDSELAALRSEDFVDRFNQAARYRAKLRGRSGDSAALWVYPEVKLQTVVLQRAAQVAPNGNVLGFEEHQVRFPIPAIVHFIGARTA